ncbi:MAG TPA: hypothetical protein ENH11_10005 [Candidatus Acetothermia bacterium]|nr:hypothetical protein [Candidatus Acetothermia bacterium]
MHKIKVAIVLSLALTLMSLLALGAPVLTIYSQGIACVQDTLTLSLTKGISDVKVPVPASIIAESALISTDATLLSQSFDYTNAGDLETAAVGKKVEVMTSNGVYRGTLLSYGTDTITILDSSGIIRTIAQPQQVNLGNQDAFSLDPVLTLKMQSEKKGDVPATISYLTRNLSWAGSYICVLDKDQSTLSLQGQITLRNQCGLEFSGAKIRFVAGDVNQVTNNFSSMRAAPAPMAAMEPGASVQSAFEYHLYTLPGTIDLANGDSLVVPYAKASTVAVNKTYIYDGARDPGVQVKVSFVNSAKNGLGIPLPAGTVRLFGTADGALLFLGEDTINHTAKDETVNLTVGSAFDLVGERTQVSREKIAPSSYRATYSIVLRNHKDVSVSINVREHLNGTWNITISSQAYEKVDSNTINFTVIVPAGGESKVGYTVEYNY